MAPLLPASRSLIAGPARTVDKTFELEQTFWDRLSVHSRGELLSAIGDGWHRLGDDKKAAEWFRRAAQQGFARAQYNLGVLYTNGDGVPQDPSQAAQWFRRAADQEDAKAQYNLGLLYAKGVGVPQDYREAYVWFTLAAARMPPGADHEQAVRNRDIVAARLTPAQLDAAQVRASTWQPPELPTGDTAARPLAPTTSPSPAASRLRR